MALTVLSSRRRIGRRSLPLVDRGGALRHSLGASPDAARRSAGGEHRDEAREARLEVGAAQGDEALGAFGAGAREPGLAQELEVVAAGGRGDLELLAELAAEVLAA